MATASVYKSGLLLGTGSVSAGATSITSYSGTAPGTGRNVQVMTTGHATSNGVYRTRITADGGATLTTADADPFT